MNDKPRLLNLSEESPWFQLFVTIVITIGIGSVLTILLTLAGIAIFGSDLSVLAGSSTVLRGNDISFLRYMLISQDIAVLAVPAVLVLYLSDRKNGIKSAGISIPALKDAGLVLVLTCCLFPITSFTGEINAALHLPQALSGIEEWMIEKEKTADNLINSLINSTSTFGMILNLFTIAIVPAIAEELIFRGVLQKILGRLFRSVHMGIWVTAIFFSTVHFQFFGFLPRLILGLAFGYLYFWSGTLWLPILAHFINNAFPVILSYTSGVSALNEPSGIALWKQALVIPVPLVIIISIMIYFRNQKKDRDSKLSIENSQATDSRP